MANEIVRRMTRPASMLRQLLDSEASGGVLLMIAAAAALVVANSPWAPLYAAALHAPLAGLDTLHWINDGLMAVFFLLVGLEIKRELLEGQLATWSRRALPGIAAAGGMLVPALVYAALNWNDPQTLRGWAIPAATDIAFALGVISLIGPRVPASLKVFLAALAILDDLGAVAIIAVFYTADLSLGALALATAAMTVLVAMTRLGVVRLWPYLLTGAALWVFVLWSGVHATIAGVALAFTIPMARKEHGESPLHRLEHAILPWVSYGVVPVFGFANAGVSFAGVDLASVTGSVPLGVGLGLFLGKQAGVLAACWIAVHLGIAHLPAGANWLQLYGVALLCGIGFTMSLFIGVLAFPAGPDLMDTVKVGVLLGSTLSALAGWLVLRSAPLRTTLAEGARP
ncbi:MAG TPA: Na+/H+ antiporter NhaA [Azospirillum sp.]|nr:Na+/H+ antiporter NhaA [Azospirillum sp.]